MATTNHQRRGAAILEFALSSILWVPLLLGTLTYGTAIIRSIRVVQVDRDLAHIYALGVTFSPSSGTQNLVSQLGQELGLQASGGQGVVILSTIMYIGRNQCAQAGYADSSTPPNPTTACTNYQHYVFTHRIVMGDSALRRSSYGTPTGVTIDANGFLTGSNNDDYITKSGARADAFQTLIPYPHEDATDGFQAGSKAYLVEVYVKPPDLGLSVTSPGAYAHAVF